MEEYNQEAVDAFSNTGKPIPGQSLTSNPDEPRAFEGSPEFTNFKEALDFTASEFLLEENYTPLILAIDDGVPITDLAMQIGYVGFREGKWNPDLMMMLLEPLMYLLMSLAEKAGIEYRIDSEDEDDVDEITLLKEKSKNIADTIQQKGGIPLGGLPANIVQDIQALEMPQASLLSKPEQEMPEQSMSAELVNNEQQPEQPNLLDKG